MRSIALLVGFLVGASACSGEGPTSPPTSPSTALATHTLSGTVAETTPSGLVPVSGVLIRDDSASKSAISDQNGMYNIAGLQAMNHTFLSSKSGYVSGRTQVMISGDMRLDITIVRATAYVLSGVAFEVTPNGNVPVEGVNIYCDGCGEDGHTGLQTDARGSYTFPFVYPAVQYLQVWKQGYRTAPPSGLPGIAVTVTGDSQLNIQMVRQ